MLKRAIGTRYARALFDLANKNGKLAEIEKDYPVIINMITENSDLKSFLFHPAIGNTEKKALLEKLLKNSVSDLFADFVNMLVDKNREPYIELIWEDFKILLMDHNKQETAKIYTPFELSPELKSSIAAGLSKSTGKKVEINEVVDSSLIGGIKVQIGDKVFDGSIKSSLAQLSEALHSAKV